MPRIQSTGRDGKVLSVTIPKALAVKKKWKKGTSLNFRLSGEDVIIEEAY